MNGLPADFKTEFLCGKTLSLVSVMRFQVDLSLEEGCLISISGEVSLDKGERLELPCSLLYLFQLIDQKVVAASSTIDGTLSLAFERGQTLHVYDSNEKYESYTISKNGEILAVV